METREKSDHNLLFTAILTGGPVSGCRVELASLEPTISVYQNGGAPFALPEHEPQPADVAWLGRYDLVGPLGPDVPIYVQRTA
jgi:hypothetical protein